MVSHNNRIEQSDLQQVSFKNDKTRFIQESVKARNQKVYMAMLMGNRNSDNVRILFNTEEGEREVVSRIWACTDKSLVLKGGIFIPIGAVIDIILD